MHENKKNLIIAHIDDESIALRKFKKSLERSDLEIQFSVEGFSSSGPFLDRLKRKPFPDILLLDFELNGDKFDGISLAKVCRAEFPNSIIILCSSYCDEPNISRARLAGADDYISKFQDNKSIGLQILQIYQLILYQRKLTIDPEISLRNPSRKRPTIIGTTLKSKEKMIPFIVDSAVSNIYVEGESGTGKEVIANLIHYYLPPGVPFEYVNCGSITPSLAESELFGHKKGSFTGANTDKIGILEKANGGWLFLDEVNNLSIPVQMALLRAIENKQIRRVGDTEIKKIQFKLVSASNESAELLIKENRMRRDFHQRIAELTITLPPLRERKNEIREFIDYYATTLKGGPYEITPPAVEILQSYHWQEGNVRELRNVLTSMTSVRLGQKLTPLSIPEEFLRKHERLMINRSASHFDRSLTSEENSLLKRTIKNSTSLSFEDYSDLLLLELIKKSKLQKNSSLRTIAKNLNISRPTLAKRLNRIYKKGLINHEEITQWKAFH